MEDSMTSYNKTATATAHTARMYMYTLMSSGTELSAMVLGQRVHPILILVTFFFWGCLKATFTAVSPKQKKLKENIRREDANIPT
jgi:hypothetical protein